MKIAVTGAAGYLGRVTMPFLEKSPLIDKIVAIDVVDSPTSAKTTSVKRDVRDPNIVKDFEGCDAVVHLAFIVMPIRSEAETNSINIDGSRNVFEKAAEAGVKKIVHLSSVASYGGWADNPVPLYENSPLRPMPSFYYSRTKGAVEAILNDFEPKHPEIKIVRLRPCIFLGPKINNMMTTLVQSKKVPKFSGPEALIQFVWDEDVSRAIVLTLEKDVKGAFNIAGDGAITMDTLANLVGGKAVKMPYGFALWTTKLMWALNLNKWAHPGWVEIGRQTIVVNCDKAKKELGWVPSLDSKGSVERFVREYKP